VSVTADKMARQRLFCFFGMAYVCALLLCAPQLQAAVPQGAERPKIALVLSGGGAKGAAHLGVLKVLEEMRIPVDIVLGTSMGSYVAGMYAMGFSADEVTNKTLSLDWNKGYKDKVTREDLSLRKKEQADKFQLQANIGLSNGKVKLPEGVYQGQGMSALLREATSNLPALQSFDELPIPYRAIATDMETVAPVVLSHGNLAMVMQASMSIPGALKPIVIDNRLLADGGIVNNLPVDIAIQMGAQVIIAVDISDKLKPKSELNSAFGLLDQLTTYMTRSGTEHQLALLREQDLLLMPDVASYSVSDFDRMPEIVQRGVSTAEGMRSRLRSLSVSREEYADYQAAKLDRRAQLTGQPAYYLDRIVIHNDSRLSDAVIKGMLQVDTGKVQTNENLEAGIERINALGTFERVSYEIEEQQGQNILVVNATEKGWGPDYLDFNLAFEDDFSSRSNYTYGVAYTLTNVNSLGGELRNELSLGSWKHLRSEYYTPFDPSQQFYWQLGGGYDNQTRAIYRSQAKALWADADLGTSSFVNVESGTWGLDSEVGWNPQPWNQVAIGLRGARTSLDVQGVTSNTNVYDWGPYAHYRYDALDSRFFPTRGHYLSGELSYVHGQGEDDSLSAHSWGLVSEVDYLHPFNLSERHILNLRLSGGGSAVSELQPMYLQDLGGLFNLSGYQRYQLNGRYKLFGALVYGYRLLDNNFGAFKSPVYLGFSIERGNVWNNKSDINWTDMRSAGSIYIGSDTFLGPVYLAYGQTDSDDDSFYLMFGNTFGL
jgi:NTE family protein